MAEYYVDQNHPNASDLNAGTSESAPWLTFGRATNTGTEVVAGDTVNVKNGTYNGGSPGVGIVAFIPANSGVSGNPITFQRHPGHTPTLTRTDQGGALNPVIGGNRNYITWSGFTLGDASGYQGSGTGQIVERLTADQQLRNAANDNSAPVYLVDAVDFIVRYNLLGGAREPTGGNGASVWSIGGRNLRIHNNELYGGTRILELKRNNQGITFEFNWCRDWQAQRAGVAMGGAAGFTDSDNVIRQNVFYSSSNDDDVLSSTASGTQSGHAFYNNTIYNALGGINLASVASALNVYNNIVVLRAGTTGVHAWFSNGAVADTVDYNLYRGTTGVLARFLSTFGGTVLTLAEWQALNPPLPDAGALTSDPLFVGPLDGTTVKGFKLQGGSPARNAGRVGGVAGGAAIDMGAYLSDGDVIGISSEIVGVFRAEQRAAMPIFTVASR